MNEMKKQELVHVPGVSGEAADKLVGFFGTYNALARANVKMIVKFGVDEETAQFLKDHADTKVSPTAAETRTEAKHDKPVDDMELADMIVAYAGGDRRKKLVSAIVSEVGEDEPRFVRTDDGKELDAEVTNAVITFCVDSPPPPHWGGRPVETMREIRSERSFANPFTGDKLTPHDDWMKVPVEKRVLAPFALLKAMAGDRQFAEFARIDPQVALDELMRDTPPQRWHNAAVALSTAKSRRDPDVQEAEALLYYNPRISRPFAGGGHNPPPPPPGPSVSRGRAQRTALSHDMILAIHSAAIQAGLTGSRSALLSGIDARFVAGLNSTANLSGQVLEDLNALNSAGQLADGSKPLVTWLLNAKRQTALRIEERTFEQALTILRG